MTHLTKFYLEKYLKENDRKFTSLESAQDASWKDRVQGGCNVVVKWVKDPKKAKEFNYAGDWYDADQIPAR